MGVASWLLIVLGLLMGLGRLGACPCGRPGGRPCLVGLFSRVGLVCLVIGVGNTPAAALLGGGGCPCVCGGGMLSGFWGSAPWLPGPCSAALCGWWEPGVGGLVVNCIVDASILL